MITPTQPTAARSSCLVMTACKVAKVALTTMSPVAR